MAAAEARRMSTTFQDYSGFGPVAGRFRGIGFAIRACDLRIPVFLLRSLRPGLRRRSRRGECLTLLVRSSGDEMAIILHLQTDRAYPGNPGANALWAAAAADSAIAAPGGSKKEQTH